MMCHCYGQATASGPEIGLDLHARVRAQLCHGAGERLFGFARDLRTAALWPLARLAALVGTE